MTLPTLTWNLVGPVPLSSASLSSINGNPSPKAFYMYTLKGLIGSSSYWMIDNQDVTGSATEALVLKPNPALSATPNVRVVVTMNISGVLGGASAASCMQDSAPGVVETTTTTALLMGFTPDVSPNPTWVTGSWNSDRPYGPNVRWSKYWPLSTNVSYFSQMYLLESSETLWIGVRGRRTGGGIGAGAWMVAVDSGSGETDGRIYGMTSCGNQMDAVFWTNSFAFPFGHTSTAASDHAGVFIVSGGVKSGPDPSGASNANSWDLVFRSTKGNTTGSSDGNARGTSTTADENLIGRPVDVYSLSSTRFLGVLRQVYMVQDLPGFCVVQDPVTTRSLGFTLGFDVYSAADAVMFGAQSDT